MNTPVPTVGSHPTSGVPTGTPIDIKTLVDVTTTAGMETRPTEAGPLLTATPYPDAVRMPPEQWAEWPVVPQVSARALQIYQQGLALGRDPHSFSKVGDCQAVKGVLLGIYDLPGRYNLPEGESQLQTTIDQFAGSFDRDGMAVRGGFNAAAVLSPIWADPQSCQPGENPIQCEIRTHNPSVVIISLEVWFRGRTVERYEEYMRQIIEYAISQGVLPVLSTKADNVEGDHSINLATARLAYEYDLPLWNFWRAVQPLDHHGIDPQRDGFHITTQAWDVRSFTALQTLDAVWRAGQETGGEVTQVIQPTATQALLSGPVVEQLGSLAGYLPIQGASGSLLLGAARRGTQGLVYDGIYRLELSSGSLTRLAGEGFRLLASSPDGVMLAGLGSQAWQLSDQGASMLDFEFDANSPQPALRLPNGWALLGTHNAVSGLWLLDDTGGWTLLVPAANQPMRILPQAQTGQVLWQQGACTAPDACQAEDLFTAAQDGSGSQSSAPGLRTAYSPTSAYTAWAEGLPRDKSRLMLAFAGGQAHDLGLNGDHVVDFAWAPDGSRLAALIVKRSDYYGRSDDIRPYLVNPLKWWAPQAQPPLSGLNARLAWSPDSQWILIGMTRPVEGGGFRLAFALLDAHTGLWQELGGDPFTCTNMQVPCSGGDFWLLDGAYWVGAGE